MKLSRRDFTWAMLGLVMTYSLVKGLGQAGAVSGPVAPEVRRWLVTMEEASAALREHTIQPREWQAQIETLLGRVEMKDLLAAVDYELLAKTAIFPKDHESVQDVDFSKEPELPAELSFSPFFYAMKKDVAIVPHGHRNMATMHMVLSGQAHGRHYERLGDIDAATMIIRPTHDAVLSAGAVTTISDQRDNVHWFKAVNGPVFLFNIGMFKLDPAKDFTGREYVDPDRAEKLPDGSLRVRRIGQTESYKLYGKS
jgi:hypothetical protein